MDWKPISEKAIWDDINSAWKRMSFEQKHMWEIIRINPEKWVQNPWGNDGGGFWIVALIGKTVIWYNDIEDGYNRSSFTKYGEINEYWCNQDELEWAVQHIINQFNDGYPSETKCGPPQSGEFGIR